MQLRCLMNKLSNKKLKRPRSLFNKLKQNINETILKIDNKSCLMNYCIRLFYLFFPQAAISLLMTVVTRESFLMYHDSDLFVVVLSSEQ